MNERRRTVASSIDLSKGASRATVDLHGRERRFFNSIFTAEAVSFNLPRYDHRTDAAFADPEFFSYLAGREKFHDPSVSHRI